MKVAVMVALFSLFCLDGAVEKIDIDLLMGLDIDPRLKQFMRSMQAQIDDDRKHFHNQIETERKDKEALRADMQAQIDALGTTVEHHTIQLDKCMNATDSRRNLQSQGSARQGEVVRIFKRDASALRPSIHGSGTSTNDGGHRRFLVEAGDCDVTTMAGLQAV